MHAHFDKRLKFFKQQIGVPNTNALGLSKVQKIWCKFQQIWCSAKIKGATSAKDPKEKVKN